MTIEHNIIATALTKPHLIKSVDITADQFTDYQLAEIWEAVQTKIVANEIVDWSLISVELQQRTGQQYVKYIGQLLKDTLPASNESIFCQYIDKLKENHRISACIAVTDDLRANLTLDPTSAIDACISSLMALRAESKKYSHDMKDMIGGAVQELDKAWNSKGLVGISTGLEILDEQLGGLHKSDLIILGARPAMGKTALAINMMLHSRAGFISSEQSVSQIGMRVLSLKSGVSLHSMRLAKYDENESARIFHSAQQLANDQIYVNDKPGINILEIQAQAREWKQKYDIQSLYIDYIQKIKPARDLSNKTQEVGEIAEGLKNLAKELDIPVIALAQVNRECEKRTDQRPMASDLKDCGVIEQEADVIMMLYRDEVYNEETDAKGIAEINIEKNRSGPIGDLKCAFEKKTVAFKDLEFGF
jgi:replicative DNA helicase